MIEYKRLNGVWDIFVGNQQKNIALGKILMLLSKKAAWLPVMIMPAIILSSIGEKIKIHF